MAITGTRAAPPVDFGEFVEVDETRSRRKTMN
jgi:hypothetical protein